MSFSLKEGITLGAIFHLADSLGWVVVPFDKAPQELRAVAGDGEIEPNAILVSRNDDDVRWLVMCLAAGGVGEKEAMYLEHTIYFFY
ncbi:hypothetical protein [Hymenobacter metallicola]|uniref:Uncharacterized protein n=1 Tax=Hymenobacter metallicola TaxID=2563114 RepID=A0A4Z0QIC1_9BACT|nr:hypothetical protein [Hymenobacter metallicola]TGE29828.1 hypothetical protein E5K02_10315 [Hymenobacter metallicola]